MNTIEREVGNLEARMETVEHEIRALRQDVREIRDALVGVKGGWRLVMLTITLATTFGAFVGQYLPMLIGGRP
jgi:chromosome condensin MukBEF ATPase and DNA-binding subunit MukB